AVVAALAVVAAGGGYAASQLGGSGGGGGKGAASATAAGGIKALAAKDPLRAVIAKNLPDVQCSVTRAPAGGAVVENALCVPSNAGARSITRLNLTMFRAAAALPSRRFTPARIDALAARVHTTAPRQDVEVEQPFTGAPLGVVPRCTPEDVAAAIERARGAQAAWAQTSFAQRRQILLRFH